MIVEFCGIPGGGKSTLSRSYVQEHKESAVLVTLDMYKRFPTLLLVGLFLILHPYSFLSLLQFVTKHHTPGLYRYSLHLMLRACAKYQKAQVDKGARVKILDEGMLHMFCTIPNSTLSKTEMSGWLKRVTHPDGAVVAVSGVFHRFHNKEALLHPRAKQGAEQLSVWEKSVRENTKQLYECLKEGETRISSVPSRESGKGVGSIHSFIMGT
jgi:hypothetical protein